MYPLKCIDTLKNWISLGILAEKPVGTNLVAINGFTKTGKSTLAQAVLPSLMKMFLAANPVNFKISYIYFEISKHKGNGFDIAHSFLTKLHSHARRIGITTVKDDCKHIGDVVSSIESLMNNLHTFAIKHNVRVLFVWDEIQRFFQCEDFHYESIVELFKFVCVSSTSLRWTNFFFVFTGSGMAMAWRGFKSSSVQGFPLYTVIRNLNIESNNSVPVQKFVYDKFASIYGTSILTMRYYCSTGLIFECSVHCMALFYC